MITNVVIVPFFFIWSTIINFVSNRIIERSHKIFLFPLFDVFLTCSFLGILRYQKTYFIPYFFLISALGITIQTDLQCMLISRYVSIYLAPTGILFSYFNILPISLFESIIASIVGYFSLYTINAIFYKIHKKNGLGQGDLDLMALIGAYTGLLGCWFAVFLGSLCGTILSYAYMGFTKKRLSIIPLGPFLSIGSIMYILYGKDIIQTLSLL